MRIFVASWFFPPNSSSEGFVTYKLLRNSQNTYDVVCSTSHAWGYKDSMDVDDAGIRIIPVDTSELEVWKKQAIEIFAREHEKRRYDAIMTRSMPSESLEVGLAIRAKYPEVKWIASAGDPIANNPYVTSSMEICLPAESGKDQFIRELEVSSADWSRDWTKSPDMTISTEAKHKLLQEKAMRQADAMICPSAIQREFMLRGCVARRFKVVPHSFDSTFYSRAGDFKPGFTEGRINLVYLGYSDKIRSLMPIVKALKALNDEYPELAERLSFHVYGNNPSDLDDYVRSFQMPEELCMVHGNCSYWQSLAVMRAADWLVHVDGYFKKLASTGGSIFFAGKLADYMGAKRPILALTGKGSPADVIIRNYGGLVCSPKDLSMVYSALISIARGAVEANVDEGYARHFNAKTVARDFDAFVESLCSGVAVSPAKEPEMIGATPVGKKVMTVCVPCYNGAMTLERCLKSLLLVERPERLDVLVVDDGSSDASAGIAKAYAEKYSGIVRLLRKPNGGHGSGINAGISHAAGDYFRVVDVDDWVESAAFSEELDFLESHTADSIDVCYSNYRLVDSVSGDGTPWSQLAAVKYGRIYKFEELDVEKVYFTMAGTAFRTAVLRESGLRCQEHCFYTDSEYILKPIPFVRTAVFLKPPVYRYWRGQEGQSVSFASFVKNYENHYKVMRSLIAYYKKTEMPDVQRRYFYRLLNEHLETHYRIMDEFDTDKARASARRREFDAYLKAEMRDLYLKWAIARFSLRFRRRESRKTPGGIKKQLKHFIKMFLPYGMIRFYQKEHYGF